MPFVFLYCVALSHSWGYFLSLLSVVLPDAVAVALLPLLSGFPPFLLVSECHALDKSVCAVSLRRVPNFAGRVLALACRVEGIYQRTNSPPRPLRRRPVEVPEDTGPLFEAML